MIVPELAPAIALIVFLPITLLVFMIYRSTVGFFLARLYLTWAMALVTRLGSETP